MIPLRFMHDCIAFRIRPRTRSLRLRLGSQKGLRASAASAAHFVASFKFRTGLHVGAGRGSRMLDSQGLRVGTRLEGTGNCWEGLDSQGLGFSRAHARLGLRVPTGSACLQSFGYRVSTKVQVWGLGIMAMVVVRVGAHGVDMRAATSSRWARTALTEPLHSFMLRPRPKP